MNGFNRKAYRYLVDWKKRTGRKPLIIRGARQVGKTFLVKQFAGANYRNFIYINLDDISTQSLFKTVDSIKNFADIVRLNFDQSIYEPDTLIFIDEVQNAPNLIKLFRAFYEQNPEIHIISAGSLLEVQMKRSGFEFPVGRVEYLYIYPLSFLEFLTAGGDRSLYELIMNVSISDKLDLSVHKLLTDKFFEYLKVGGMPEAVASYLNKPDLSDIERIYSSLLTSYAEDTYKYSSNSETEYTQFVLNNSPLSAGGLVTYANYMNSNYGSRSVRNAFVLLEKAMVLRQIESTSSVVVPLAAKPKRPHKLLFLDFGFTNLKANLMNDILSRKDLGSMYKGQFSEQVVGQNLILEGDYRQQELYYWSRKKPFGSAEVDFVFNKGSRIVAVEVKTGISAKLRSLSSFAGLVDYPVLFRVYGGELKLDEMESGGKKYKFLSIPFYLVNRIFDFVDQDAMRKS